MKTIKHLIKIWFLVATRVAQSQLLTSWGALLFLFGKVLRFLLFFVFIFAVSSATKNVAGLSKEQVILFFLIFNLIDTLMQFLFRGVYVFRPLVVKGNFDFDLLKPLPSFFRPLFGWTDILDLLTLIPLSLFIIYFVVIHHLVKSPFDIFLFILMLLNAIVIGFSFHLFISSIAILTTAIDHLTMVYRDMTSMARFPTDIYTKVIQFILTFSIPVIVLITIPAKALTGILSLQGVLISYGVMIVFLLIALKTWNHAIAKYTSASS